MSTLLKVFPYKLSVIGSFLWSNYVCWVSSFALLNWFGGLSFMLYLFLPHSFLGFLIFFAATGLCMFGAIVKLAFVFLFPYTLVASVLSSILFRCSAWMWSQRKKSKFSCPPPWGYLYNNIVPSQVCLFTSDILRGYLCISFLCHGFFSQLYHVRYITWIKLANCLFIGWKVYIGMETI